MRHDETCLCYSRARFRLIRRRFRRWGPPKRTQLLSESRSLERWRLSFYLPWPAAFFGSGGKLRLCLHTSLLLVHPVLAPFSSFERVVESGQECRESIHSARCRPKRTVCLGRRPLPLCGPAEIPRAHLALSLAWEKAREAPVCLPKRQRAIQKFGNCRLPEKRELRSLSVCRHRRRQKVDSAIKWSGTNKQTNGADGPKLSATCVCLWFP